MKYEVATPPSVGDFIYVTVGDYATGGKAMVKSVVEKPSLKTTAVFVETWAEPGTWYNWYFLAHQQDELQKMYGSSLAHPDGTEMKYVDGHPYKRMD